MSMSMEIVDAAIESIKQAKSALLEIDPRSSVIRRDLDEAYRALNDAALALLRLGDIDE
jgi:hypothetical protein